jgi:hypothetical protein
MRDSTNTRSSDSAKRSTGEVEDLELGTWEVALGNPRHLIRHVFHGRGGDDQTPEIDRRPLG